MKKQIKINYHWECNESIEIPDKHKDALKEDAVNRIFEMIKEGYNSGELHTSVRYGKDVVIEEDEEDGLTYSGYWEVDYN
jgi:hypothetical protein